MSVSCCAIACWGHQNTCKPCCDLMHQANLQMTKWHVVFQVEALLTQPQISKPVLLITLQQGISSWHLPPLKWETVCKWLGCRHQGECNLHSQIGPSVRRLLLRYMHKAGEQRVYCTAAYQMYTCGLHGVVCILATFRGQGASESLHQAYVCAVC